MAGQTEKIALNDYSFEGRIESLPDGGDVVVASVQGSLSTKTAPDLEKEVMNLLGEGHSRIVLDCESVQYVDSTAIGILIKLIDVFAEKEGWVRLARMRREIRLLLDTVGLQDILANFETVEEALKG